MTLLEAILLGILEGFTEFLPISSTAHLLVGAKVLSIPDSLFLSSFIIAIQVGAILAIVLLFWRTIILDFETMKKVFVAFIPTAFIGFVLYKLIKNFLFENFFLIALALIVGGVILILFERYFTVKEDIIHTLSYTHAFLIGCFQSLAVVPGVSRAGATILGGLYLGVPRRKIVEFSFLLAVPTMLAATAYDLYKTGFSLTGNEWSLLSIGFFASALSAFICVRFLISYVQRHSFEAFGWYRIALGLGMWAFLI